MYYLRRGWIILRAFVWVMIVAVTLISCNSAVPVLNEPMQPIVFPYKIPDTPLTVIGVVGYEGAYVEGEDEEVVDVAALMVQNDSENAIEHAYIAMYGADQLFEFELTYLPANSSLMVLESAKKLWIRDTIFSCSGEYTQLDEYACDIKIIQTNDGLLQVENTSEYLVDNVRIYHKNWSREAEMYLGGISYQTHIVNMEPGQILLIRPDHYVFGISRIVHVTARRNHV